MSNIDSRIVKASFRGNPPEERKLFSLSTCLMPISVGQRVHEGKKFEAVIKLINSSFKSCSILVDDTVQRHTIGILNHAGSDRLHQLALAEGDSWMDRSKQFYTQLEIPYEIKRWDDWYNNPDYPDCLARVKREYADNALYRSAIHENIDDFLARFLIGIPADKIDSERAFSLCLDYLLEECSVMCLWTQGLYDFEVYPSGRNKAMAATYQYIIQPEYPDLLKPVALRFKKSSGDRGSDFSGEQVRATHQQMLKDRYASFE